VSRARVRLLSAGVARRWKDLDDSAIGWHYSDEFANMQNPFTTEDWQLAVNRIY
jgi:hypothetical protein